MSEIARIYQFIEEYKGSFGGTTGFIEAADTNGDGVILKREFTQFVEMNWNGGGMPSDDIIEKFWKSIDVIDDEGRIYETDLKNYRSVTAEEIDRTAEVVKNWEDVSKMIANLKAPTNLTPEQQSLWKKDMGTQLSAYFDAWVSREIKEDFNLDKQYQDLVHQITPYHAAEDQMRKLVNQNSTLKNTGYDWMKDWNGFLGRNVNAHMKKWLKEHPNATGEEVVTETQRIANGMIENADLSAIGGIGSEEFKQTNFTELQKVFLNQILRGSSEVMGLLSGVSENSIKTLFERFFSFYYHYDNTDFKEDKANAVPVFLEWFKQYGEEILNSLGEKKTTPTTPTDPTVSTDSTTSTDSTDSTGSSAPVTPPVNVVPNGGTEFVGNVYYRIVVEDHRNADAQHTTTWSYYVTEADGITRDATLEDQLEQLAIEQYCIANYGLDIVEVLDIDY